MKVHRARLRVLLLTGVLILPILGLWVTSVSAASHAKGSNVLTLKNNHMSAKIEARPLREVLQSLGRLTNIEIALDRALENEPVSVEFNNLPLEEGIRHILQGKNYALTYAQITLSKGPMPSQKIVGIRVVPKGAGTNSVLGISKQAAIPLDGVESHEKPNSQREPGDEAITAEDTSAESKDGANENKEMTPQEIVDALKGEDPSLRESAMDALKGGDGPVPFEPLSEMAMKDSDPLNRMEALTLLAVRNGQAAMEPIEQALNDPDPGVSNVAVRLLEDLKKYGD
jgi:hypothetical protein